MKHFRNELSTAINLLKIFYPSDFVYIVSLEKICNNLNSANFVDDFFEESKNLFDCTQPDFRSNSVGKLTDKNVAFKDSLDNIHNSLLSDDVLDKGETENVIQNDNESDPINDSNNINSRIKNAFLSSSNSHLIEHFLNFLVYKSRCSIDLAYFYKYIVDPLSLLIGTRKVEWMTVDEYNLLFRNYKIFQRKLNMFLVDFGQYLLDSWPTLNDLNYLFYMWYKLVPICSKLLAQLNYSSTLLMEISVRSNGELEMFLKQAKPSDKKLMPSNHLTFLSIYDFLETPHHFLLGLPYMVENLLMYYQPDWKRLCIGWSQLSFGLNFISNYLKNRHMVSKFMSIVHKIKMPVDFRVDNRFLIHNQSNVWITNQSKRKRNNGNIVILNNCLILYKITDTNNTCKLVDVFNLANVSVQEDGFVADYSILIIGKINYLIEFSNSEQKMKWILIFIKYLKRYTGCYRHSVNYFVQQSLNYNNPIYLSKIMDELMERAIDKNHIFSCNQKLIDTSWKNIKEDIEHNFKNIHNYSTESLLSMILYYFKKSKSPLFSASIIQQLEINQNQQLNVGFVRKVLQHLSDSDLNIVKYLISFLVNVCLKNSDTFDLDDKISKQSLKLNPENLKRLHKTFSLNSACLGRPSIKNSSLFLKNYFGKLMFSSKSTLGITNNRSNNTIGLSDLQRLKFNTWPFNRQTKFLIDYVSSKNSLKIDTLNRNNLNADLFHSSYKNNFMDDSSTRKYKLSNFSYLLAALFTPAVFGLPLLKPDYLSGSNASFIDLTLKLDKLINFVCFLIENYNGVFD